MNFLQKIAKLGIFFSMLFVQASAQEIEPLELKRSNVEAKTIVDQLSVAAYTYNINLGKVNAHRRYYLQAERWNLGKLIKTWKTKPLSFDPKTGKDSFFISFPVPPRMDILLKAKSSGQFVHEILPFGGNKSIESGYVYTKKTSSKELLNKSGIILGFLLKGYTFPPEDDGSNKKWPKYENFESELDAYHKTFLKHKRADVDIIVYRLLLVE